MAVIDFPTTIPLATDGAFSEGAIKPWIDDASEVGSPRRRQRFTREIKLFSYSIMATGAEKDAMETFYITTTGFGVQPFNWTHPATAVVYEVQFSTRPNPKHVTADNWSIDISLEEK